MILQMIEMSLWSLNHYALALSAVLLVVILVVVLYNRVYMRRANEANARRKEQNAHLALVLQAGRLRIWKYLPATRHYLFLSEEGTMEQRYNPIVRASRTVPFLRWSAMPRTMLSCAITR